MLLKSLFFIISVISSSAVYAECRDSLSLDPLKMRSDAKASVRIKRLVLNKQVSDFGIKSQDWHKQYYSQLKSFVNAIHRTDVHVALNPLSNADSAFTHAVFPNAKIHISLDRQPVMTAAAFESFSADAIAPTYNLRLPFYYVGDGADQGLLNGVIGNLLAHLAPTALIESITVVEESIIHHHVIVKYQITGQDHYHVHINDDIADPTSSWWLEWINQVGVDALIIKAPSTAFQTAPEQSVLRSWLKHLSQRKGIFLTDVMLLAPNKISGASYHGRIHKWTATQTTEMPVMPVGYRSTDFGYKEHATILVYENEEEKENL